MKKKTLETVYREGCKCLEEAKVPDARLDAWYLLEYVTGVSRASYYGHPEFEISKEKEERYFSYIKKRSGRTPLQHLTGEQEFMGLPFYVNEHVLIPRQDTEILAETALEKMRKGMRILDMCTGSGCILISLLNGMKGVSGTGTDISSQALAVAEKNAERLNVDAVFLQSDLFENLPQGELFDLIISNPPYIPTAVIDELEDEVRLHDPYIALDGKEDGLFFYRRIAEESIGYIKKGGWLLFEIGCGQAEEVSAVMRKCGYAGISVKKDLAGLDRVVYGMYNGG